MNGDHHPVGSPSAESGRAKIVPAELRERIRGTKIAIVLTKREATALLDRIEELEVAVSDIAEATDPDNAESYRCDDREGCLDTVQAIARKALSGEQP